MFIISSRNACISWDPMLSSAVIAPDASFLDFASLRISWECIRFSRWLSLPHPWLFSLPQQAFHQTSLSFLLDTIFLPGTRYGFRSVVRLELQGVVLNMLPACHECWAWGTICWLSFQKAPVVPPYCFQRQILHHFFFNTATFSFAMLRFEFGMALWGDYGWEPANRYRPWVYICDLLWLPVQCWCFKYTGEKHESSAAQLLDHSFCPHSLWSTSEDVTASAEMPWSKEWVSKNMCRVTLFTAHTVFPFGL